MNPGFRANLKSTLPSVLGPTTRLPLLKALVLFGGKIDDNDHFTHLKQAMHAVWGSYLYGI